MSDPVHPFLVREARIVYRALRVQQWQMRAAASKRRSPSAHLELPYDQRNPVVYAKDWSRNCYTDDLVMALASARRLHLRGFVTSSSTAPYNHWVSEEDYQVWVEQRAESVRLARQSGLRHIPDPIRGPDRHLAPPSSGRIEDTMPLDSDGSRLVVSAAREATPEQPLLVVACTGLTLPADAYLLDPSIADRIIVLWLGGHEGDMACYGGWSDGWAAYIALERLCMYQFPPFRCDPVTPKRRMQAELPPCPFRDWMLGKAIPRDQGGPRDADAPPIISIVRQDFVLRAQPVAFGGWIDKEGHQVPRYRHDPQGTSRVVTLADRRVATAAWWAALTDPAVYAGASTAAHAAG
jgi:hypothetical protein